MVRGVCRRAGDCAAAAAVLMIQTCVRVVVVASALSCRDARSAEVPSSVEEHRLVRVQLEAGESVQVLAVEIVQVGGTSVGRLRVVDTIRSQDELGFTGAPGFYTLLVSRDGVPQQPLEVQIVASLRPGPTPPTPPPPPGPGPTPPPDPVPPDDSLGATGAKVYSILRTLPAHERAVGSTLAPRYRSVLAKLNDGTIASVQVGRTAVAKASGGLEIPGSWKPALEAIAEDVNDAGNDMEQFKRVVRGTIAAMELASK